MWRMLGEGELPTKVGGVVAVTSLKAYARAQGVNNMRQIRRVYHEGLLPPLVGACPRGRVRGRGALKSRAGQSFTTALRSSSGLLSDRSILNRRNLPATGYGPRSVTSAS